MCRSSRILSFLLCCAIVSPAAGQGRVTVRGTPRIALPTFRYRPAPAGTRFGLPAPIRGMRSARGRLTGYGTGLGVLGFDGAGIGVAADPFPVPDPYLPLPASAAEGPAPCAPPLIIVVGNGLRRVARTRVVYGMPRQVCGVR